MSAKLEVTELKNKRWRWNLRDQVRKGANGNPLILASCRPSGFKTEDEARDDFTDVALTLAKSAEAPAPDTPERASQPEGPDPVLMVLLGAAIATAVILGLTYLL